MRILFASGIMASLFLCACKAIEGGGDVGGGRKVVFVQAHQDDEIQYLCIIREQVDLGNEVHCIWLRPGGKPIKDIYGGIENYPLVGLGVNPANLHFNEDLLKTDSRDPEVIRAILDRATYLLDEIKPDKVFIQQWAGGHYDHSIAHVATVAALKKSGLTPEIRETRDKNRYYVVMPASFIRRNIRSGSELKGYLEYWSWYSQLIPPKEDVVSCSDGEQSRIKEYAAAKKYKIGWIQDLLESPYWTDDLGVYMMTLFSRESHKRFQKYDYTKRPYGPTPGNPDGSLGFEPEFSFSDDWKKIFLKTVRNWMKE